MHNHPIGIFDSGVGGLSVLREVRRQLPHESLLYIADSAHAPYGPKSREQIQHRSTILANFLVEQGSKAIVVACNTATAAAVGMLRDTISLPIIGMEPAVKPAAAATRSGIVGVLATEGTLQSARFAALLSRFADNISVLTQPCHGLVELIEAGNLEGSHTESLLHRYIEPLLAQGADTIILGCTHYPFVRPLVERIAGPSVSVIDTGHAVARHLHHTLIEHRLLCTSTTQPIHRYWSSARRDQSPLFSHLLGEKVRVGRINL